MAQGVFRHKGAKPKAAIRCGFDFRQWQAVDIDEAPRPLNVFLHQVDQVGPAGDELGLTAGSDLAERGSYSVRAGVREVDHFAAPLFMACIACSIAATMLT